MRKIFITYGDNNFTLSKQRLIKEVRSIGIFDRVIAYGPEHLPSYVLASPLMAYERGGGYWCWKPYIIWKTICENPDSIVVYVDAGCSVQSSENWNRLFDMMDSTDALVTAYRSDYDYGWKKYFGRMTTEIGAWTKPETCEFFDKCFGNKEWRKNNKILGGMIFAKGRSKLIKSWLDITLMHPQLVFDTYDFDKNLDSSFICHRHDQSLLTPLAYYYSDNPKDVLIVPELSESDPNAPVIASRIRDDDLKCSEKTTIRTKIIRSIKRILGKNIYEIMHKLVFGQRLWFLLMY